jgi:UDP-N-acetylmuramoylalanine-D-glutamate ligase
LSGLAQAISERCVTLSLIPGISTHLLDRAVTQTLKRRPDCRCELLRKAEPPVMETILSGIHPHLEPGDVVLLSPAMKAADSNGPFATYKERGEQFGEAVRKRYGGEK